VQTPTLASELRFVIGKLVRRLRAERGDLSLTHVAVLARLDREGPCSVSDLAAAEHVRPQSMAQTVGDLEGEGFVARRPDPADGRRALVSLTGAGSTRLNEDRQRREGWLALALAQELSAEERRTLAAALPLLRRIAER
jgi:DNA-binding MarR family transcriptional regulator